MKKILAAVFCVAVSLFAKEWEQFVDHKFGLWRFA